MKSQHGSPRILNCHVCHSQKCHIQIEASQDNDLKYTLLCGVAVHMTIFSISILYTARFPRETQSTCHFFNFCLVNCILVNCQHLCLKSISRSYQLHTVFMYAISLPMYGNDTSTHHHLHNLLHLIRLHNPRTGHKANSKKYRS